MKSETERRTCRSVALYSVLSLIGKLTVYALFLKEVVERQSVLKSVHFYGKKDQLSDTLANSNLYLLLLKCKLKRVREWL